MEQAVQQPKGEQEGGKRPLSHMRRRPELPQKTDRVGKKERIKANEEDGIERTAKKRRIDESRAKALEIRKAKQGKPERGSEAVYIDVFSDGEDDTAGGKNNPGDASDHNSSESEDVYCEKCGVYVAEGEKALNAAV